MQRWPRPVSSPCLRHLHCSGKRKIINNEWNKQGNLRPLDKIEQGDVIE